MSQYKYTWIINYLKALVASPSIRKEKLFVMSFDNSFSCNPSYIVRELLKITDRIDVVWAVDEKTDLSRFPEGVRTVIRGSKEMFFEMRSAHVWLDNALNCVWYFFPKRRNQIYINTWHGSLGIKKLGGNRLWKMRAATCNKKTDYCITNSVFEEQVFKSTFWKDTEFLKFGHARNSVLLQPEKHQIITEKVHSYFSINRDVKLALYAPTFKEITSCEYDSLDYFRLKKVLEREFGGEWIILSRLHHRDRTSNASAEGAVNASNYADIQELMIAADIAITDYSSWIYDFLLLNKPGFVFAPDIDKYDKNRGFYYSLHETPFPVCADNDSLEMAFSSFNQSDYLIKVHDFLCDKGCYEVADSAKKAAEFIVDMCI